MLKDRDFNCQYFLRRIELIKLGQRYLATSFIPPFIISATFLVAFLLIFQLLRIIRIVINRSVEYELFISILGDIALSFLPMALPLAIFFATYHTLDRFSKDSEIMAMHSLTIGKKQIIIPFLGMGLLIGMVVLFLEGGLVPLAKARFKNTLVKLGHRGVITDIRPGQFFTDIPQVILFAKEVDKKSKTLKEVFILISSLNKDEGVAQEQIILAKEGVIQGEALDPLSPSASLNLDLTEGSIVKTSLGTKVEKILFQYYRFPLTGAGRFQGIITKAGMQSWSQLKLEIKRLKMALVLYPEDLYLKKTLTKSLLEHWLRINFFLQCIVFALWGMVLGMGQLRGRVQTSATLSIALLIGHYSLLFLGVALAKNNGLPPFLVALVPNALSLVSSFYILKKRV